MAEFKWYFGPMNSGKSTLALQLDHNYAASNRKGVRFTKLDRAGNSRISSRLGIEQDAIEVAEDLNFYEHVTKLLEQGLDYIICDETQFYTIEQVEQLGRVVDCLGVEVCAFGIATDFTSTMFPASRRLFELADMHIPLQVTAMCWCGKPARMNARVVNGELVVDGEQVVIGDVDAQDLYYVLLCRDHFTKKQHKRATQPQEVC